LERFKLAVFQAIELGEDEIPELKVPVAVACRAAGFSPAAMLFAPVNYYFRTWPARAGLPHVPEIVFFPQKKNSLTPDAYLFLPYPEGFIIIFVDRYEKLVLRQSEDI
jgi:hypothetical protein